ncbi:MAG: hypothetical protein AAFX85_11530, partial [Pseudomonadota bacterium]
ISSDGGQINLFASEAILANGRLLASTDATSTALGGSLSLRLDMTERGDRQIASPFPVAPRVISLNESNAPIALNPGAPLPDAFNGVATLSQDQVVDGGFADLSLAAVNYLDLFSNSVQTVGGVPQVGRIEVGNGVNLELTGRLALDANEIASNGGSARLAANTALIGPTGFGPLQGPTSAIDLESGVGTLEVGARVLEFVGATSLQGFAEANFTGTEAVRFLGVISDGGLRNGVQTTGRELLGSLRTRGDLSITGDQLHPGTLSDFEVAIEQTSSGELRLGRLSPGAAPERPLAVGGSLSFRAPQITSDAVLRAPLGALSFDADALRFEAGALLDTSTSGDVLLFGEVQAGTDWVFELPSPTTAATLVFQPGIDDFPTQGIQFTAGTLEFSPGAQVDVSGGGEVLAYEFVPGIGGSRDVLSFTEFPDAFAIVPSQSLALAPRDPVESLGFDPSEAPSVFLFEGAGVAQGEYLLLPSRYLLLYEDAVLVESVAGLQDIVPGDVIPNLDGSTTVAGAFGVFGSGTQETRLGGVRVTPRDVVLNRAEYTLTSATDFLPSRAADFGVATQRTPLDAGAVSFATQLSLTLPEGDAFDAQPGERIDPLTELLATGRGATVDISADRLALIAPGAGAGLDDFVLVDADTLGALGVESLLLGGVRADLGDELQLDTTATELRVTGGASLAAPEVLLTATDVISLEASSVLQASGTQAPSNLATLSLEADGALVRLSSGAALTIERAAGGSDSGDVLLEAGALLSASGAAAIDVAGAALLGGDLQVGDTLTLGGSELRLGAADDALEPGIVQVG